MILTFDQKQALGAILSAKTIEDIEMDKVRLIEVLPGDIYEAFISTIWDESDLYEELICYHCERAEPIRGDGTCAYCGEDGHLIEVAMDFSGNMWCPQTYGYIKPKKVQ